MATLRALVNSAGSLARIPVTDDLAVGSGINTESGNLTIQSAGGTTTMSDAVQATAAGTGLAVTNNATIGGTLTNTGAVFANGGVDRSAAAALSIGITNASSIDIGKVGALTTVKGDFQVDGVTTLVGTTNFTTNAQFNGNVTFGDAVTDTVTFVSRIATDIHFLKEVNHIIDVDDSTTATTVGGSLTINSADGNGLAAGGAMAVSSGAGGTSVTGGGAGGALTVGGGVGGAGNGTGAGGAGGTVVVTTGTGGVGGSVGAAGAGGALQLLAGAGGVSGSTTGNSGVGGLVELFGGVGGNSAINSEVGGIGGTNNVKGGAGGAGFTSGTAGAGGSMSVVGGRGGASAGASGTAGAGASVQITGGQGGSDNGGTGGIGGNVTINPGQASGAAANGSLFIGTSNTTAIAIGNGTVPTITVDGASFSIDASGASNVTVSGAAADLTLGARGATITLNESGQTTLTGFTATSIVGALNELAAAGPSAASEVSYTTTAGEVLVASNLVSMDNDAGTPRAYLTDINEGAERENPVGIAKAGASATAAVTVIVGGEVAIPDALWDSVPVVADVGKKVYAGTAANGVYTLTPPTGTGDNQIKVGIVSFGGAGAVKIVVQIGEGVQQ